LEINVFRVVSELLNNSVKHGSPGKIEIKMEENGNYLRIEYEDDGAGFDFRDSAKEIHLSGMGLENIRSRIKSLNGYYYMDSEPGEGVKVHIQIPLK
jgi:signal transduction histidine kinase